jgi:hypothetical protein
MTGLLRVSRTAIRLQWLFMASMVIVANACSNGDHLVSSEAPLTPIDSLEPPGDPPTPPPTDSTAPPPPADSTPPPPPPTDTTAPPPPPPADPPVHSGIPFGPYINTKGTSSASLIPPSGLSSEFTGLVADAHPPTLMAKLEEARRTNGRVLLSFAGAPAQVTDENGFSIKLWKQSVDRFRRFDLASYIADGTLVGNFIMDEPNDPTNWNGRVVALAEIDEMARYSKEIWPDLPTIIRAWPDHLKQYEFKYLDAAWAQYHIRFGSVDDFIASNIRDAKASGLALVMGLNVLGGGGNEGLLGYHNDRRAMTASMVRTWGSAILAEPYACAFFMFRFNPDYFQRPDIKEAMTELSQKAQSHPERPCRRS